MVSAVKLTNHGGLVAVAPVLVRMTEETPALVPCSWSLVLNFTAAATPITCKTNHRGMENGKPQGCGSSVRQVPVTNLRHPDSPLSRLPRNWHRLHLPHSRGDATSWCGKFCARYSAREKIERGPLKPEVSVPRCTMRNIQVPEAENTAMHLPRLPGRTRVWRPAWIRI